MEASRDVKLTGTNKPCGLTNSLYLPERLNDVPEMFAETWERRATVCRVFSCYRFFDIVWDDRHGDETTLLAAFRPAGPQAPSFPVVIGAGSHPFPFRTRKLSLPPPMVLHA